MPGVRFTLNADSTQAERALTSLRSKIGGVGVSLKGLAVTAFGLYGVQAMFSKTVEYASDLVDASQRLSIPVEQLQVLREAAKQAGVEFGKLQSSFEKINLARDKALGGGADAQKYLKSFAALGVTQEDLKTKTSEQLFTGKISNAAKNNRADEISSELKDVLGKSFGELMPVLQTDFGELHDKMQSLGSIMDTDTAVQLDYIGDQFGMLGNIITVQLGPAIITLVKALIQAFGWLKGVSAQFGANSVSQAKLNGSEEKELAFLEGWKRKKGKFSELMNAPEFNSDLSDANKALLFKSKKAGIDNFVQRRIDFLRRKDGIASKVGSDAYAEGDDMLKSMEANLKAQADKLKHPKPPDYSKKVDANKKEVPEKFKSTLGNLASSDLLKVGGLMGVDANYRLQRLSEESNRWLRQIAQNTEKLCREKTNTSDTNDDEFGD